MRRRLRTRLRKGWGYNENGGGGNQLSFCRLVYANFGLIDTLSLIDFAGRHIRCVSSLNVT